MYNKKYNMYSWNLSPICVKVHTCIYKAQMTSQTYTVFEEQNRDHWPIKVGIQTTLSMVNATSNL